jgi:manganese/zinc/iron transport system permease protein
MTPRLYDFLAFDLPAMIAGTLAVVVCGLLGNFLLLRRLSLMGDAISHSVLPGLVAGFLIVGSRSTLPMFLGAAAAGLATVGLVELIRKLAKLESGAAMGVVFSILFALGVLLIEQAAASGIDLDPDCVLNGQLERIFWSPPHAWAAFWSWSTVSAVPREVWTLGGITLLAASLITVFFKELRIAAFDPALATSLGLNARWINGGFMVLVAAAVVASFEAVGSILVIAMLVCPPATARLLTDRLATQLWLSAVLAGIAGLVGYVLAAMLPLWLGLPWALNAAGMMTLVAGVLLTAAIFLAPTHGLLARRFAQGRLARAIAREDLLASLYRAEEAESAQSQPARPIHAAAENAARAAGEITGPATWPQLTPAGREVARDLVRRHRLWEQYLVESAGLKPDHVHPVAEDLEHVADPEVRKHLQQAQKSEQDPHGRQIP